MSTEKENNIIDEKEFAEAEKAAEASGYSYTLNFRKPFEYNGKTFKSLTFDWDRLTGRDSLNIENEIVRLGKALVTPAFSGEYIIRMAAKACTEQIGSDIFEYMPLAEYNKVRSAGRSFLLKSEF